MNLSKTKSIFLGCLLALFLPAIGLAQAAEDTPRVLEKAQQEEQRERQERQQQQRIDESREQFLNAQRDGSRRSVEISFRSPLRVERDFMSAVPQFWSAVANYKQAVRSDASVKDSLKDMERFVDLFKDYFKTTRVDAPVLDKAQFNTSSRPELVSETLTTAERVDGQLRLAVMHLLDANDTNTVSIETVLFMRDLHGDVLRLDLLLSKIK